MRVNGEKVGRLREAKGLTQASLAKISDVHSRTIQRAEGGGSVDMETLAQIAASLEVPQDELISSDGENEARQSTGGELIVLTPVRSPGAVIDLLREGQTCTLDYLVDGEVGEKSDAILALVNAIEPHLPTLTPERPMSGAAGSHLEANNIRAKLAVDLEIANSLKALKDAGLALYLGRCTVRMPVPYCDRDGNWVVSHRQSPEDVRVAVLRIDRIGHERIVVKLPLWGEIGKWISIASSQYREWQCS
jgi:transcriptional regulator with XRE-family HTH domain